MNISTSQITQKAGRKKTAPRVLIAICALVLLGAQPTPASANTVLLKIDGFQGTSKYVGQEGAIVVSSLNFGNNVGGFQELSLTKQVDRTSPQFFLAAASQRRLPVAVFEIYGDPDLKGNLGPVLNSIVIYNVLFTSFNFDGAVGQVNPGDNLSAHYDRLWFVDHKTGQNSCWSTVTMSAC